MEQHESGAGLRRRKGGPDEGATDERVATGEGGTTEDAADEGDGDIGSDACEGDVAGAPSAASAAGAGAGAGDCAGASASAAASAASADGAGTAGDSPAASADGAGTAGDSRAADASPGGLPPPPTQPEGTIAAAFSPELALRIVGDFPSCCSGQFMAAACSRRRFLTCLGVHRGMAVFAWAPGKDPQGFAAHLTSGAIRFSLEKRGTMLPEMIQAMKREFEGVKKTDVVIQMVGDFIGEPLKRYFADFPAFSHCASLHIEAALRREGFRRIDKEMCAAFEDSDAPEPTEEGEEEKPRPEVSLVGDARRFSFAALDLRTGRVIAQAKGTVADVKKAVGDQWPAFEAEYNRDKEVLRHRHSFSPLTRASGSSADFWTAYYEMVAQPVPWVLGLIAVGLLLAYMVASMLPSDWGRSVALAVRNAMVPGLDLDSRSPEAEGSRPGAAVPGRPV